jgi:eukaryotic-like serine/threonine-protein kinase
MRFCPNCSYEITGDSSYCQKCDAVVEDSSSFAASVSLPEFESTLHMPFPEEAKAETSEAKAPEPDFDARTLGDAPISEAAEEAKTLETDDFGPIEQPLIELSARDLMPHMDSRAVMPISDVGEMSGNPIKDSFITPSKQITTDQKVISMQDVDRSGGSSSEISETDKPVSSSDPVEAGRTSGLKPLVEGIILNSRYEIVRKIGGGGMGAVYLAQDRNLGSVLRAVKEMVQSSIEETQQKKAIEDFKRESMILAALDHPSIPTIFDYFFDSSESRFYLVMKYIAGGDLASRLRAAPGGRIDERTVTEWALQIIDVLSYLHTLPETIVYRDLKPSNIMIDEQSGRVMLIDFGIARSIDQGREQGVTAVGTMGYAPPELFSGNVEPRSDIYSLGSTMFHLLTGADPQNNPLLIFDFQKNPRPRQINSQLSDQMERILMKAVEYNADSRFSTAAEMQEILANHLENLEKGSVTHGVTEIPEAVSLAYQNVFCGFCGQRIIATDLFCAFCGAQQPLAQHGVHSEIYVRTAPTAKLVIDGTDELECPVFELEKGDVLLGRRDPLANIFPEVDLSKFDPQTKISRRHARIWRDGRNFMVEDLGSSNGTTIMPQSLDAYRLRPREPHPLASGDRLRLGDTTLHFLVG